MKTFLIELITACIQGAIIGLILVLVVFYYDISIQIEATRCSPSESLFHLVGLDKW